MKKDREMVDLLTTTIQQFTAFSALFGHPLQTIKIYVFFLQYRFEFHLKDIWIAHTNNINTKE